MSDLAEFCRTGDSDEVGEFLRAITFPGEGFGCYETFDVREGATEMDEDRRTRWWTGRGYESADDLATFGRGYTFHFDDLTIIACWYWDGDGVLTFAVWGPGYEFPRFLENGDCKTDYCWADVS